MSKKALIRTIEMELFYLGYGAGDRYYTKWYKWFFRPYRKDFFPYVGKKLRLFFIKVFGKR